MSLTSKLGKKKNSIHPQQSLVEYSFAKDKKSKQLPCKSDGPLEDMHSIIKNLVF